MTLLILSALLTLVVLPLLALVWLTRRSGWRMRHEIFWARPTGWQWAGPLLAALLLLLGGAGINSASQAHRVPDEPVNLTFPLRDGAFYVASGGSRELLNPHMKVEAPGLEKWRGQLWCSFKTTVWGRSGRPAGRSYWIVLGRT